MPTINQITSKEKRQSEYECGSFRRERVRMEESSKGYRVPSATSACEFISEVL
jgi:hypothetical protein